MPTLGRAARHSSLWGALIVVMIALALASGSIAIVGSIQAQRFIGEGELLYDDAGMAASRLDGMTESLDTITELRRIRNNLEIEAVSLISSAGTVLASTSEPLVGQALGRMLSDAVSGSRFVAVAAPLTTEVVIDGVVEWTAGDVLYQAVHPLADGAIMLSYDLSELLHRRTAATKMPTHVVPLAVLSGTLMLVTAGLAVARARALALRREMTLEAEFLRRQSEALQEHNRDLEMARAETEAALALAEEKNRIRSEFVLMINHELRTPLTGVVTGARLLQSEGALDGEDRRILDDMLHDGERLESIIGQMLAVARVENRGLEIVPVEMRVSELIARLERAHKSVEFHVADDLAARDPVVMTDATTLAQMAAGLADNALTHGAKRTRVTVEGRLPGTPHLVIGTPPVPAVHVIVSDDGPGIERDFLPRAFDKFAKSSRSSGTGLGLHFAKMMAESISASIAVHTTTEGTWIAVGIPLVTKPAMAEVGS